MHVNSELNSKLQSGITSSLVFKGTVFSKLWIQSGVCNLS